MTLEEKVDQIHAAVMQLSANSTAKAEICQNKHDIVDARLNGLHKKISGNGQPGIEQNLVALAQRLDRIEIRLAFTMAGITALWQALQVYGPKIAHLLVKTGG